MASSVNSKTYARIDVSIPLPDLIEVQLESFERLKAEGLADLFHEISPIESYNKGMKLYFPSRTPESEQWDLNNDQSYGNGASHNANDSSSTMTWSLDDSGYDFAIAGISINEYVAPSNFQVPNSKLIYKKHLERHF